ncbi:MAG: hypothetical protein NTZ68_02100 [Candidatus Dependentiae bacterium]|nr:hypothetical protein [Candidatus Dependentiae bacterium]
MEKKQMFVSRLADQLVKQGAMGEAEAASLVNEFKGRATARIDDILIDEGIIDRETMLKALQGVFGLPPFDVRGHFFNHQLLLLFPKDFLLNKGIIPLDVDEDMITVVMSNPEDEQGLEEFGNYVAYTVNVYAGIQRDIVDAIEEYYDEDIVTYETHEQTEDIDETGQEDSDIIDLP